MQAEYEYWAQWNMPVKKLVKKEGEVGPSRVIKLESEDEESGSDIDCKDLSDEYLSVVARSLQYPNYVKFVVEACLSLYMNYVQVCIRTMFKFACLKF